MREEAERKAFQQAVDRRLSALTGDPRLAQKIRAQAQTEGEPKMKKKLSFALVAALALALISAVALAAANWASIREFLGQEGTVARMDIVEDAIVKPTILQYDGKTLDIQANEAYWSAEGLSLTFHVTAREKDKMVVYYGGEIEPDEDGMLWFDGESISLADWSQGRGLLEYDIWVEPTLEGWAYFQRDDEGESYIMTLFGCDEKLLAKGCEMQLRVRAENMQTNEVERSSMTIKLPPMIKQEGRK